MIELARDAAGVMPRMLAVNHHPEIVDRFRQVMILSQKRERGEVSEEWYQERLEILTGSLPDEDVDRRLHLTSDFTLLGPLRFYLFRKIRLPGGEPRSLDWAPRGPSTPGRGRGVRRSRADRRGLLGRTGRDR